ncbi:hypothetical protein ACH4SP_05710 [Streptomyces sp. NPDC021093]|uniref:hypothetical protein n=1 Tax=Streptomyces sp. NPDC021093 TaxID=3365112 RepID=UPI0037BAD650
MTDTETETEPATGPVRGPAADPAGDPAEESPPVWLVVANVVRFRRYGEGGQELRPGTKAFKGGAKVHLVGGYAGMGYEDVTVVGRSRRTGAYLTIDIPVRHLHTFRASSVHSPAVLRRYAAHGPVGPGPDGLGAGDPESAREWAVRLEALAREHREGHWRGAPHPEPCRCHECTRPVAPRAATNSSG